MSEKLREAAIKTRKAIAAVNRDTSNWDALAKADNALRAALAEPAPDSLGAVWKEAEAALPEGWHLCELGWPSERDDEWRAVATGEGRNLIGYGPIPTAALRALTEKLRAQEEGR